MSVGEVRRVKLVDIAAKQRWALNGGPFGSKLTTKHYTDSGVPVIRGTNLSGGSKFSFDDFVYVSEEKADELRPNNAHPGDIIFTQRGTIGQVGLIPRGAPFPRFVISQSQMKLTPDPEQADAEFLYYLFSAPATVKAIENLAFSAGVPHINLEILRNFEVNLPPLRDQRRIAEVLATYDELIASNRRRIQILEEMARALYREWFVEFRFPGQQKAKTASAGSGALPSGWVRSRLGDVAEDVRRNVPKGELEEARPFVGLEHIPRRALALDAWEMVTSLGSNKLEFKRGEILFGKIRPYFHKVSIAPFDGLCSADTIVIHPKRAADFSIVAACVSSDDFVAHASATANGAKMPRANWDVLKEFQIILPPEDVARPFRDLFEACVSQQQVLVQQVHNLREARDLLLPRLLSGRMTIGKARL